MVVPSTEESLERLRHLCMALPGTTERLSHGEPSWFVKKQFVMFADHHHDDRVGFVAAAPDGAQQRWLALDERRFYRPPYVGGRGWIGVYLDVEQDWDDIADIVDSAHAVVAPAPRRSGEGRSGEGRSGEKRAGR
ncbi:MmcQ/YjbR family DNA-binding protein [Nakamurella sp. GG22]